MIPRLKWHMLRQRKADPAHLRENLLAGLAAGAALEVDVVTTADGHFVCLHDLTLDAETTGHGAVAEATREEIWALRQRANDGTALAAPPLFLDEVVAAVSNLHRPGAGLVQLDIKDGAARYDDATVARLGETLCDAVPAFIAGGCDWPAVRCLRDAVPGLLAGFDPLDLYRDRPPATASQCEALAETAFDMAPDAAIYYLEAHLVLGAMDLGVDLLARFKAAGAEVDVWTLDAGRPGLRGELARLIALGVDQVTTNDPRELALVLGEFA
jgi:glycerophosphoryl diester phosphodiesterase